MIIEIDYTDNLKRFFKTDEYRVSSYKNFFADCLKIIIRSDTGKKIKTFKRPFIWWYKHVTFKTKKIQEKLKEQIESIEKNK